MEKADSARNSPSKRSPKWRPCTRLQRSAVRKALGEKLPIVHMWAKVKPYPDKTIPKPPSTPSCTLVKQRKCQIRQTPGVRREQPDDAEPDDAVRPHGDEP